MLKIVGVKGPNWLFNPDTAMPAVMLMTLWAAVGYYMIIFLAGLAEFPRFFTKRPRWMAPVHAIRFGTLRSRSCAIR